MMNHPQTILVISSSRAHLSPVEALRLSDIADAATSMHFKVEMILPNYSQLLRATVACRENVTCFTPLSMHFPLRYPSTTFLARSRIETGTCRLVHGINDGARIARAAVALARGNCPFIAELVPGAKTSYIPNSTLKRAAAVLVPDESYAAQYAHHGIRARVSVLPEPHAEMTPTSFTAAEYATALSKIYAYATRNNE